MEERQSGARVHDLRGIVPDDQSRQIEEEFQQRLAFLRSKMATTFVDIPSVKLNNGREMPVFGLGTWCPSIP